VRRLQSARDLPVFNAKQIPLRHASRGALGWVRERHQNDKNQRLSKSEERMKTKWVVGLQRTLWLLHFHFLETKFGGKNFLSVCHNGANHCLEAQLGYVISVRANGRHYYASAWVESPGSGGGWGGDSCVARPPRFPDGVRLNLPPEVIEVWSMSTVHSEVERRKYCRFCYVFGGTDSKGLY
jgi:hypothetical protein